MKRIASVSSMHHETQRPVVLENQPGHSGVDVVHDLPRPFMPNPPKIPEEGWIFRSGLTKEQRKQLTEIYQLSGDIQKADITPEARKLLVYKYIIATGTLGTSLKETLSELSNALLAERDSAKTRPKVQTPTTPTSPASDTGSQGPSSCVANDSDVAPPSSPERGAVTPLSGELTPPDTRTS